MNFVRRSDLEFDLLLSIGGELMDEMLPKGESVALYPNVHYNLPGLFQFSNLIYAFIKSVEDKFSYKVPVSYLYGAPLCRWNGGRLVTNNRHNFKYQEIREELTKVSDNGIIPLLTFSNLEITAGDLEDEFCNEILEVLEQMKGSVIVSSPLLEQYIRKHYHNIKIHCSVICTAFANRDAEYYTALSKRYDYYVINPDDNFNLKLLSSIPNHNAEILVNERCYYGCKQRAKHYLSISREQVSLARNDFIYEDFLKGCNAIPESKQLASSKRNISCTQEELKKLIDLGFNFFKLQGRTDNLYTVFFDIMRYTLDNNIAFPALYPIFCSQISKYLDTKGR